jgi:hypothetical protein
MQPPRLHKPSPAMIVALAALVAALGGTALAAGTLVNGDNLIKKGSLSGNRLRSHTVKGAQIKVSSLPKVPRATRADSATHALSANSATHATSADTATTASGLPALNWVPLTLINGWADGHAPDARTPAVAVDAQGIVHFRGDLGCTGASCASGVANMPSGFAPSQDVLFAADEAGFATGRVIIKAATGTIFVADDPEHPGSAELLTSLEGLTYPLG